jgi:hypothetical protein
MAWKRAVDGYIMVAPYRVEGDTFRPEKPSLWSDTAFTPGSFRRYTLDPKSDRFAVGRRLEEAHRVPWSSS